MLLKAPSRRLLYPALAALLLFSPSAGFARPFRLVAAKQAGHAAPQVRPVPVPHQSAPPKVNPPKAGVGPKQNQEHLAEWMDRHRNLSPEQQQQALENEPGFRQFPPQEQQRLRDRLTQLNNMPEEQRRRLLARNEAIEHLTPAQRQQIRSATQQFNSLPPDRRRLVQRAFRDLREMPEPQRQAILGSDRLRGQFSENERSTLNNLLAVEPYIPVERPSDTVNSGK